MGVMLHVSYQIGSELHLLRHMPLWLALWGLSETLTRWLEMAATSSRERQMYCWYAMLFHHPVIFMVVSQIPAWLAEVVPPI